ncbi:uncharacterized protein EI90DRAFT_1535381 [Cantharellus anzutake]|uniref:uncharacterized protein n=1 Tax=Cantharellus anzutake TaxID=1750568 RepID=UPI001905B295|nr:uncharacterized protein EI90DRAFT_1535381 [Cantharellus anzutake]KAF8328576.1 hypothetical protein EI90DRAFT_1535381 [Cantharellus anzutake]
MAKVYDQLAQHRLQVETVTAGADRAITTLTEQMHQTNEVVSSMSSVVQAQSHTVAALNRLMAGMVHTIGGQMQVSGLCEEITLLVLERDHAKTDAEKDAITNKIMVLHQRVQSASEMNSVLFKSLSDLQIGTSMTIDCLSPQQAIQSSSIQFDDADMALESPGTPDDPGPSAKHHRKVPYLMHSLLFHASVIRLCRSFDALYHLIFSVLGPPYSPPVFPASSGLNFRLVSDHVSFSPTAPSLPLVNFPSVLPPALLASSGLNFCTLSDHISLSPSVPPSVPHVNFPSGLPFQSAHASGPLLSTALTCVSVFCSAAVPVSLPHVSVVSLSVAYLWVYFSIQTIVRALVCKPPFLVVTFPVLSLLTGGPSDFNGFQCSRG